MKSVRGRGAARQAHPAPLLQRRVEPGQDVEVCALVHGLLLAPNHFRVGVPPGLARHEVEREGRDLAEGERKGARARWGERRSGSAVGKRGLVRAQLSNCKLGRRPAEDPGRHPSEPLRSQPTCSTLTMATSFPSPSFSLSAARS